MNAAKWLQLAAKQGNPGAQYNLGLLYYYGDGVLQDNLMSHMWLNVASANGNNSAGEPRDAKASQMTSAEISKAQAMARECMNSDYTKCGY